MAIQGSYSFRGIDFPDAYLRFVSLNGTSKGGWVGYVGVYPNADAAQSGGSSPLEVLEVISGPEPGKSAYELLYAVLKTEPYAAGMTDVFETGQDFE
ncbi:hypothetical protein KTD19_03560 [Burkholderia multivorans]|uniref:hypothetical protein n=1 Tax=Burkholderia multivorans TaxID=87883 RepID=UPI001C2338D0|nr:hypothetical protein [Burkholderia multivorans]MBU9231453.1 hypothetical protein [Burkholderia multivorans]